ncbi:MAG: MG2 domain-containing protein, partial [bacterium]|nr:MG2 domain-containing protein [bacterium]
MSQKQIYLSKIAVILLLTVLLCGTTFYYLCFASALSVIPDSVTVKFDKELMHISFVAHSEFAEPIPAKLKIQIVDLDGNIVREDIRTVQLQPDNRKYMVSIPVKIESDKLPLYVLKYSLTRDGGYGVKGSRSLFAATSQLETKIFGQREFYTGSNAAFRIVVTNHATGEPVADATVTIRIGGESAPILFTGKTNPHGTLDASFVIPASMKEEQTDLIIKVESSLGTDLVTEKINLKRGYRILLTTDKPIYQPGQTIHIRTLSLNIPNLKPARRMPLILEVSDSKGNKVFKKELTTDRFGIAAAEFELAEEVNLGVYAVKATLGKIESEKKVTVDRYVLPKFKIEVKTDKQYYLPGEMITGDIQSDYFFGKPVTGGKVTVVASKFEVRFEEFARVEGILDNSGHYRFELKLPDYFAGTPLEQGNASVKLDIAVIDSADHKQEKTTMLTVSKDPINLYAIPESGTLVPNVENIIYIMSSYPDGSPAPADLETNLNREIRTSKLTTNELGIAKLRITPKSNACKFTVSANDKQGNTAKKEFSFSVDTTRDAILLRPDKSLYQVGQTAQLHIFTTQPKGTVYLDVVKDGQTFLTKSGELDRGKAVFDLVLDPTLTGSIQL